MQTLSFEQIKEISIKTPSKIVLLVMDGLGGLPDATTGKSELEMAHKPNIDRLAAKSNLGLAYPVQPGIAPGSGPGHLALFGYNPVTYLIKRGILEALGIGVEVKKGEIATRGNFCIADSNGIIVDRRAGRMPTEENAELCKLLSKIKIPGVEIQVHPVKDYRLVVVFSSPDLNDEVTESDPLVPGTAPLTVRALEPKAQKMANIANEFLAKAKEALKGKERGNMILLRGFSSYPHIPAMQDIYQLNPVAIAVYPMYRGLASLAGMKVVDAGNSLSDELDTLKKLWHDHDFFYVHVKATDAAGEDGDFQRKKKAIEDVDVLFPRIMALNPDVVIITGDHSTPSNMASHSWHPVPYMIYSKWVWPDNIEAFDERNCGRGSLGRFQLEMNMVLAMANAQKLVRYGA